MPHHTDLIINQNAEPPTDQNTGPIIDHYIKLATTSLNVTTYSIPYAEYLDTMIRDLTMHPERATITTHSDEYSASASFHFSVKTPYGYNPPTRSFNSRHESTFLTISVFKSYNGHLDISINQYPIIIHLTENQCLKIIDTFITLCHTSHRDSTLAIKRLYEAKQYIQEATYTHDTHNNTTNINTT